VYSTFFGIELGKRALITQQLALSTTSHNIANANTPGYSRQLSSLTAATPFLPGMNRMQIPVQLGTGVKLATVQRARDMLLEREIQQETSNLGTQSAQSGYFQRVDEIINEPTDQSLGQAPDDFWAAWHELSVHPEDTAVRASLVSTANQLSYLLKTKDTELRSLQQTADSEVRAKADQINLIGSQIRDLNVKINQSFGVATVPNDLMDKRDQLLEELGKLTNFDGHEMTNGLYDITIGGHTLVQDNVFIPITVGNDPLNNNFAALTWSDDGAAVQITAGDIKGLSDMRDLNLPVYRQALTDLAVGLANAVNPVHAAGYALNAGTPSGLDFFTGTDAQTFQVNAALIADPTLIAAAQNPNAPGDGSNALALAQLQNAATLAGGTQTVGEFWQNLVAQVGLDGQHNALSEKAQSALLDQLTNQRESISGVNLDEEMTDMIKYQDGYQAAIRVISTMDAMLDTIINKMGAGR
jgi:flagellar hook-associated protein 1